ncbi:hypothetical protein NUW58_g8232 [Xylaria curta]|uniref:Uncharacterized protein n=1 Tax=Xylaria curta TaxID=42375 RepID=A0ACC1N9E1_9PEZI|nr:hypothetical protein NUW58_g8232 [Xylaria curta]
MGGKFLFTGGYVATLDESLGDFPVGAVLVEDGIIQAVGKAQDVKDPEAEVIDTTDGVVIPGMVDTHRHVSMSLTRGIGADQALFHFLSNTYMRWLPATGVEDIQLSALVGALEAIDCGVTTIVDTCESFHSPGHAEAELQGLKDSGIRAFFCFGMAQDQYGDVPSGLPAWKARLSHIEKLHLQHSSPEELTQVALQLSIIGTVPYNLTAAEIKFADQRGMFCCSHSCGVINSETIKDITVRADCGLMLPGHLYIHCTSVTAHELDLIAETGGKVSIAMETDMQMGMGFPPIRECIERDETGPTDPEVPRSPSCSESPSGRFGHEIQHP